MTIPRILVVDDDPEMRNMMTQFLRQNGSIALPAATEVEISRHLEAGRIDLILLDVMLGDENGLDICRKLRTEQDVPVIMVSALSADNQRMAGYEVGADDYIVKPFNPKLLLARVKAVLSRARRSSSLVHSAQNEDLQVFGLDIRRKTRCRSFPDRRPGCAVPARNGTAANVAGQSAHSTDTRGNRGSVGRYGRCCTVSGQGRAFNRHVGRQVALEDRS